MTVKKLYDVGFNVGISAHIVASENRERLQACASALGKTVDDLKFFQVSERESADRDFWQFDAETGIVCSGHLWPDAIYVLPLHTVYVPAKTYVFVG